MDPTHITGQFNYRVVDLLKPKQIQGGMIGNQINDWIMSCFCSDSTPVARFLDDGCMVDAA